MATKKTNTKSTTTVTKKASLVEVPIEAELTNEVKQTRGKTATKSVKISSTNQQNLKPELSEPVIDKMIPESLPVTGIPVYGGDSIVQFYKAGTDSIESVAKVQPALVVTLNESWGTRIKRWWKNLWK